MPDTAVLDADATRRPDASPHARDGRPLRVLLAGGGTAGHVNPLLATAHALRSVPGGQDTQVLVLGTEQGLESRLVPEAGYELAFVPRVPLPRRPSPDLLRLPVRLRAAVAAAREAIEAVDADVVVGFGGYVSTPAYLAARSAGVPVVIHEQNARPGLANRLGARWARTVALTFASTPLAARRGRTVVTGLPLRAQIAALVEACETEPGHRVPAAVREQAAGALGLDPSATTLLVTGGSLGAQHLNEVVVAAAGRLPDGMQVLHLTGRGKDEQVRQALAAATAEGRLSSQAASRYHVLDYLTAMEQAYACADGVICRSGAGTVAELAALGLPALYVPLPIGNGEQRLNAADVVEAGGGRLVADADLSADDVADFAGLVADAGRRQEMAAAARRSGRRDAAWRLARLVRSAAGLATRQDTQEVDAAQTVDTADGGCARGAGDGSVGGGPDGSPHAPAPGPLAGRAFHLIGVGGAGMSVVAQLLVEEGATVTGSDAHEQPTLERLRALGAEVYVGHDAARVPQEATVVVSTAIKDTNPELAVARQRGQEVIHRSQALALAAGDRRFVAVAGAHGKTTTSGMLAEALHAAGADPSFAVGGVVRALGTGAHVGGGDVCVAEADESDRSFLNYRPTVEVVTNVEPDHLDTYASREAFEEAFVEFSRRLLPGGLLITCADDAGGAALAAAAIKDGTRVVTYGVGAPADLPEILTAAREDGVGLRLRGEAHVQLIVAGTGPQGSEATLTWYGADAQAMAARGARLHLTVPGTHVALDAAAAWTAGVELGTAPEVMARCLGTFGGTGRRFEQRGEVAGVRVIDDYAHHPTEVAALLTTAREVADARGGRVLVLFQPHLFSRTASFADRFARALAGADLAVVTAVYPARETQEDFPEVTGQTIVEALPADAAGEPSRLSYVADRVEAAWQVADAARAGDVVLTVGAGDVTQMGQVILDRLSERGEAAR